MSNHTRTSLVATADLEPPKVQLYTYPADAPIGAVQLDGGDLTIASSDPVQLRLIAEALTDAARQLADELDRFAARQMAVPA